MSYISWIQYQGAQPVPCHVSRAHFRQPLLNDIPCQSFSNFMSPTSFWGSSSAPAWHRAGAARCPCLCLARARGSCSPLLLQLLQKDRGSWMSPSLHCRPAPNRTLFAFHCTSGVGILVWEAKSFGTVSRPNPSLLALWPLMAFPHFTWDWALKCILQTWPTPSNICWYFAYSKLTPHLDFFFIIFFSFNRENRQVKVHHMYSLGRAQRQPGSPCRGLAPCSGMSTCR